MWSLWAHSKNAFSFLHLNNRVAFSIAVFMIIHNKLFEKTTTAKKTFFRMNISPLLCGAFTSLGHGLGMGVLAFPRGYFVLFTQWGSVCLQQILVFFLKNVTWKYHETWSSSLFLGIETSLHACFSLCDTADTPLFWQRFWSPIFFYFDLPFQMEIRHSGYLYQKFWSRGKDDHRDTAWGNPTNTFLNVSPKRSSFCIQNPWLCFTQWICFQKLSSCWGNQVSKFRSCTYMLH